MGGEVNGMKWALCFSLDIILSLSFSLFLSFSRFLSLFAFSYPKRFGFEVEN